MPRIDQWWLSSLPQPIVPGDLECPNCFNITFTGKRVPYGIELACLKCPTYIGIPSDVGQVTVWSGTIDPERQHARRARWLRVLDRLRP